KLAGALGAGCTMVLKPAEQTPFDAEYLIGILHRAGVPPGVIQLVQGTGPTTGAALAGHPGLNHLSFTGSVSAGRSVAALAAETLAGCTLELGGKSPAIVLPGADLETAVPAILES